MAEFLTTTAITYRIEEVLRTARKRIYLLTPFLQLSKNLLERLQDADIRGVETLIVYGKKELKDSEHDKIRTLSHVKLYYLEHLHAKCYLNEFMAIIGSMNIFEFSEKNNREMGILIRKNEEPAVFDAVVAEVTSILRATKGTDPNQSIKEAKATADDKGLCIRCSAAIRRDKERPLCSDCYKVWAEFSNFDYEENVCHFCGKPEPTSVARPLCEDCYWRWVSNQSL